VDKCVEVEASRRTVTLPGSCSWTVSDYLPSSSSSSRGHAGHEAASRAEEKEREKDRGGHTPAVSNAFCSPTLHSFTSDLSADIFDLLRALVSYMSGDSKRYLLSLLSEQTPIANVSIRFFKAFSHRTKAFKELVISPSSTAGNTENGDV
jgi:hypothetical protein